jgi:hypothetical protein
VFIRQIPGLTKALVVALGLGLSGATNVSSTKPFNAYHDGEKIVFSPETTGTRRMATFGPWNLGERLAEGKPRDQRLNLYLVVPGGQYRSAAQPEFDHNRVVNKYTIDGKPREWDIFYCFVLDPTLNGDLRSESDLLMAAHQTFRPAALFEVSDFPASVALRQKLAVNSMADLRRYRRRNGTLPRVIIVPAQLAVRATAEQPDVTFTRPATASASAAQTQH